MRRKINVYIIIVMTVIMTIVIIPRNLSQAFETSSIGTSLIENGRLIAKNDIDTNIDGEGKLFVDISNIIPGKKYEENLCVNNVGEINTYVRAVVDKMFIDEEGNKSGEVNSRHIVLETEKLGSEWIIDENASTLDRTVYYYTKRLEVGESTPNFIDKISINPEIYHDMYERVIETEESGRQNISLNNKFENLRAGIVIKIDAAQDHNAADAIWSLWGVRVNIDSEGNLSLR